MKRFIIAISIILVVIFVAGFSINFFNKPNNDLHNNSTIESVDFSKLTYCAFGDSITWGYTPKTAEQMSVPYPKGVANSLNLLSYSNKAYPGACLSQSGTVSNGLCITRKVLSNTQRYDIFSVMGGANDNARELPLGSIYDNAIGTIYGALNMMASTLTTRFPDAFIFFMTPYKTKNSSVYYDKQLELIAKAVKDVCQKFDLPCLDMHDYGNFESEMYLDISDGVHPTQDFVNKNTIPQIVDFIKTNYK